MLTLTQGGLKWNGICQNILFLEETCIPHNLAALYMQLQSSSGHFSRISPSVVYLLSCCGNATVAGHVTSPWRVYGNVDRRTMREWCAPECLCRIDVHLCLFVLRCSFHIDVSVFKQSFLLLGYGHYSPMFKWYIFICPLCYMLHLFLDVWSNEP